MYFFDTEIRVRYSETDQMNYVYYGNYGAYYEVSRVEAMRDLGLCYKSVEEKGLIMPVLSMAVKYKKPAFYDDVLKFRCYIKEMPKVRIKFDYEVFNQNGELINFGETVHAFVLKDSLRPVIIPDWFHERLLPFFKDGK